MTPHERRQRELRHRVVLAKLVRLAGFAITSFWGQR